MDVPALRYVTTPDGFSIAYTVCGEGYPLVYMPQPANHTYLYWRSDNVFRRLYMHLAARFRLICYDSRGLGSSTRELPPDFRIDDYEVDLRAVTDHLRLDSFALLAQNGFARVALKYAGQCPERVRALVLWNADTGDPDLDGWAPPDYLELARSNWDLFVDMMARTGWAPEDPGVARSLIREAYTQADWLVRAPAWTKYQIKDFVGRVRVPTLLLTSSSGSNPYGNEQAARFIASQVEGARLEVFSAFGAGLFTSTPEVPPGVLLIAEFVRGVTGSGDAHGRHDGASLPRLSPREVEVLRMIARGRSNQQIAAELVLSVRTVERHITNLYAKIGAHGKAEATAYALRNGLV
jgi:DNA-binding CsgD family transcriptional regulator